MEICATGWRGATFFGMQMSWVVRGAYANWSMTMTVAAPEVEEGDVCVEYRDDWRTEPLSRVYHHFVDVVNLLEADRQLDDTRKSGVRLA